MEHNEQWLQWAVELQALAQAGLTYGKDVYDRERYQRIREISAEILAAKSGLSMDQVQDLFCGEAGYQTPKLDTRAAVFQGDKILLVHENDGTWCLPGGWCDVNISAAENVVKEVKEEAGLDVRADLVIAVQDREKHNRPVYANKICKIFFLCTALGGEFVPNSETTETGYFGLEELPVLATAKVTEAQIKMCFEAKNAEHWVTVFD